MLTGLLCGLIPALTAARTGTPPALRPMVLEKQACRP